MPKKHYETDNAFGQKLLQVMAEQGKADDLPALAEAFGVSVPSTYDWIRHGRFAKERYPDLVRWSGRGLDWWFDAPLQPAIDGTSNYAAREPVAPYGRPAWPFSRLSEAAVCKLSADERLLLEGALMAVIAQLGLLETLRAA